MNVQIGRDIPLNGSECCNRLFSSVPFLTEQVPQKHFLTHIFSHRPLKMQMFRAPASELNPPSQFQLQDSPLSLNMTTFCKPTFIYTVSLSYILT